jgi:hypothetical protein
LHSQSSLLSFQQNFHFLIQLWCRIFFSLWNLFLLILFMSL